MPRKTDDTVHLYRDRFNHIVDTRDYYRRKACQHWWWAKSLCFFTIADMQNWMHKWGRLAHQRGWKGYGE